MFQNVMENFRQASEATVHLQQEMFKNWINLWPSLSAASPNGEAAQQFQKKWAESLGELVKKQNEVTETQFKAGLQNIEKAFGLAQAKSPEELRAKSLELWQQCFDNLKQVTEAQLKGFESAMEKWCKMMKKSTA